MSGSVHCIITSAEEMVPRPLSTALHGGSTKEVMQIDFLYMSQAKNTGTKDVLVIKEDLTAYSWLISYSNPDGEEANKAISR